MRTHADTQTQHPRSSLFPAYIIQIFLVLLMFVLGGCGASLELASMWAGDEVRIDGVSSDWPELQARIAGPDVRIGVRNDADNLYICLTTSSRSTQFQLLALGTTVWLDAEGKQEKTFGILFPLPGQMQGRRVAPPAREEDARQFMEGLVRAAQRQFEIIGPGIDERKKFAAGHASGIEMRLGYDEGTLIYELKMPLLRSANNAYGAAVDPSKPLLVGFETGDFREIMRSQMSTVGAPSGGGGGGRGGRGGGGGGAAMPGRDLPEGLRHWLTVHLALPAGGPAK